MIQNRDIFSSHVKLYVQNDAVAALASGTMGELHGCVLIAGTGTIAYGFTEDGREARAAGAGPILGDWGRYFLSTFFLKKLCTWCMGTFSSHPPHCRIMSNNKLVHYFFCIN